jgi:hypothetical protein
LAGPNRNVFINCPFDAEYRPCFEALLFAITHSGYNVRCALEDIDGANIRFHKLRKLIQESPRTIHDLSRIELGANALPRFNMPFELGLAMGAKYFGDPQRRRNSALILVRRDYVLNAYLSDLGGNDPVAHGDDPARVIRAVIRYLHKSPTGRILEGPQIAIRRFERFKEILPTMAADLGRAPDEVDPHHDYAVYLSLLTEFLEVEQQAAR